MLISEEWLKRLNNEFREKGIDQRRRPWEAIRRYSKEHNVSVDLSSELAKQIFEWFEAHSRPGAHQVGALYESVYFFDSTFWIVSVPIGYGTVQLNAVHSLIDMPPHLKEEIMRNPKTAWDYVIYWADCVDYGLGIDDLQKSKGLDRFGMQLFLGGDEELRSAVSLLKETRPNPRAILNSRMAVELFLKSFIALKRGLTEKEAKSIGHDLNEAFEKFVEVSSYHHWNKVKDKLSVFPPVRGRYDEQSVAPERLWDGFSMAQSIGALIAREFTDRNMLEQVMHDVPSNKPLQPMR